MYKMIKRERFHHMNATVETVRFDNGMTVKRLVSYDSVVCDIISGANIICIYPRYQYSPTTIRQLTLFLNENMPLTDGRWNIHLMREAYKRVESDGSASINKYVVLFLRLVLGTTRSW